MSLGVKLNQKISAYHWFKSDMQIAAHADRQPTRRAKPTHTRYYETRRRVAKIISLGVAAKNFTGYICHMEGDTGLGPLPKFFKSLAQICVKLLQTFLVPIS